MRILITFCLLPLVFLVQPINAKGPSVNERDIVVGLLIAARKDRDFYLEAFEKVRKLNPRLRLDSLVADDQHYKQQISGWLKNDHVDIAYSPAGAFICERAKTGELAALDHLWEEFNWDTQFDDRLKRAVTCDGKIYGLPFAYYYWGIFYHKQIFAQLNLQPPKDWLDFIQLGRDLRDANFIPISIGTLERWPSAAWFDYLNLRINGIEFHRQLARGEVPFTSPEVKAVMRHWKQLLDENFFDPDHHAMDWKQALPFFARGRAAMTLSGAYLINQLPDTVRKNIGFFPFPTVATHQGRYENLPVEAFVVTKNALNDPRVEQLLEILASADIQTELATSLGYLPAVSDNLSIIGELALAGVDCVEDAEDFSQFFDRDFPPSISNAGLAAFHEFMQNRDVDAALGKLENARLASVGASAK